MSKVRAYTRQGPHGPVEVPEHERVDDADPARQRAREILARWGNGRANRAGRLIEMQRQAAARRAAGKSDDENEPAPGAHMIYR
jgi:hypothetical protein